MLLHARQARDPALECAALNHLAILAARSSFDSDIGKRSGKRHGRPSIDPRASWDGWSVVQDEVVEISAEEGHAGPYGLRVF